MNSSLSREELLKQHDKLWKKYIELYCKLWCCPEREFWESYNEEGWEYTQQEAIDHIKDMNKVWFELCQMRKIETEIRIINSI